MRRFFAGLAYPFRAVGFIWRNPDLWGLILAPIAINLLVGIVLYATLLSAGLDRVDATIAALPPWMAGLAGFLRVLLAISLFIVIGYLLVRFGVVLGSPFYGQLSERIEERLTGSAPPASPLTVGGVTFDIWRALLYELKKLVLTLVIGIPLLLIGFIPVAGQIISLIGQFFLGSLIACLDFFDAPLERRRLSFRTKLRNVGVTLPASLGFGLICFGLVSLPLINLLALPVCVTAGTLFLCERSNLVK